MIGPAQTIPTQNKATQLRRNIDPVSLDDDKLAEFQQQLSKGNWSILVFFNFIIILRRFRLEEGIGQCCLNNYIPY